MATNFHVPSTVSAKVSRARANSPRSSVAVVYQRIEMWSASKIAFAGPPRSTAPVTETDWPGTPLLT